MRRYILVNLIVPLIFKIFLCLIFGAGIGWGLCWWSESHKILSNEKVKSKEIRVLDWSKK